MHRTVPDKYTEKDISRESKPTLLFLEPHLHQQCKNKPGSAKKKTFHTQSEEAGFKDVDFDCVSELLHHQLAEFAELFMENTK